jgi:ubiquinone/menaquinone biosynthesis C-methylase UbiE
MKRPIFERIIDLLKKIPIDLGQGSMRKKNKGKLIALDLIKNGKNKKALDVGCREGTQSMLLEKKGYEVVSIDIEKNYKKCSIVDANKKLPFKNDSFDLIWCSEVIEHLNNPQKVVKEFNRVIKPGGEIILTTPNSYFWLFRIASIFGLTPKKIQRKDHKHFFSKKDMDKLFPKADISGFFPYCILKFKIKRLVGLLSPTFVVYVKNQSSA